MATEWVFGPDTDMKLGKTEDGGAIIVYDAGADDHHSFSRADIERNPWGLVTAWAREYPGDDVWRHMAAFGIRIGVVGKAVS